MTKKILLSLVAGAVVVGGVAAMSAYEAHVINVTAHIENALAVTPEEIAFGTVFPQEKLYKPLTVLLSDSFIKEDRVDDVGYVIHQKPKPRDPEDAEYCLESWKMANEAFEECFSTCMGILNNPEKCWDDCKHLFASYDLGRCYPALCPWLSKLPDGTPSPENDKGLPVPHPVPECSDGIDNDKDGYTDYPDDFECFSANDDDELYPGEAPRVFGFLAKSMDDTEDIWTIDLAVPCFEGMCAQDFSWEEFGPPLSPELESEVFGCDLWVEVVGISEITGSVHDCYEKCKFHLLQGEVAKYAACWWACVLGLIDP